MDAATILKGYQKATGKSNSSTSSTVSKTSTTQLTGKANEFLQGYQKAITTPQKPVTVGKITVTTVPPSGAKKITQEYKDSQKQITPTPTPVQKPIKIQPNQKKIDLKQVATSFTSSATEGVKAMVKEAGALFLSKFEQEARSNDAYYKEQVKKYPNIYKKDFLKEREKSLQGVVQKTSALEKSADQNRAKQLEAKIKAGINVNDKRKFTDKIKDPQWLANSVAESVPSLLTSIGITVATGAVTKNPVAALTAGFAGSFAQEASGARKEARDFGVDRKTADNVAIKVGIGAGLLDVLPIAKLLDRTPGGDAIKKKMIREMVKKITVQSGLEASTESLQEIVGNVVAKTYDENRDIFTGVPESALIGGILGGVAEVGGLGVDSLSGKEVEPQEVINTVMSSKIDKTPEGKALLKVALEAKQRGQNVVIKTPITTNRPVNERNTEKVVQETLAGNREGNRLTENKNLEIAKKYESNGLPADANADTVVTVYRAGVDGETKPGDHVTLDRANAEKYLEQRKGSKIVTTKAPLRDLVRAEGIGSEFIFAPKVEIENNALEQEARKYKSAEEFVKTQEGFIDNYTKGRLTYRDNEGALQFKRELSSQEKQIIDVVKTAQNKGMTPSFDVIPKIKSQLTDIWNKANKPIQKAIPKNEQNTLSPEDKATMSDAEEYENKDTPEAQVARKELQTIQEDIQSAQMENDAKESILAQFSGDEIKAMRILKNAIIAREKKGLDALSITELPTYQQYIENVMSAINTTSEDVAIEYIKNELPDKIVNAVTKEELQKIKVLKTYIKPRTVEVQRSQLPTGEGKERVSRLESRMLKSIQNAPQEVIDGLGVAKYNQLNRKEVLAKAAKYVVENPKEAIRVLEGKIEVPEGLLYNAIYVAMQNESVGDVDLARKLASLASTRAGQEINFLKELDKDSPVAYMRELVKIREDTFKRRYKNEPVQKVQEKVVKQIKEKIKAPDKYDWDNFINSIDTC